MLVWLPTAELAETVGPVASVSVEIIDHWDGSRLPRSAESGSVTLVVETQAHDEVPTWSGLAILERAKAMASGHGNAVVVVPDNGTDDEIARRVGSDVDRPPGEHGSHRVSWTATASRTPRTG